LESLSTRNQTMAMAKVILNSEGQTADGQTAAKGSPWIYSPWLDLIVGCGAWSAPLLLISYWSIAANTRAWSITFYALALVFNYPHYMATIYRAYRRSEDFQKYRVFTVHTTALILLTLVLSHTWARILPWIFTLYLTWSPWHYSGQNYGLFMMLARRSGAKPSENVRRALYGAFVASYLILFLGFHTGASSDPFFISLGIPAIVSRWEQIVLFAAFFVLAGYGLSQLIRQTGWRKLLPSLTLFSTQFLWFLLPAGISLIKRLEIPQSRYSSGVLAVMHSAQYLWITSYYARREEGNGTSRNWRGLAYFGVLIAGGIALFVPGPWLASHLFHHDFSSSFLIFTALVNIHHFILDGAIWKLRDGRIAALLLNSRDRVSDSASDARDWLSDSLAWITGRTAAAHRLRVGAVCLLLIWGTVDQVRHYLALHANNLQDLQRAAALDSFDSSLQMRLARKELEQGHAETAEAAWRKAIDTNPADPAPRQALLRFMIEQKRFDEAFSLTESSLSVAPSDANLWTDRGLLAMQRGDSSQAMASWSRAIDADANQILPRLYLASELDREGKPSEAAVQYKTLLELVARQPAGQRLQPEKVIAILLRLADCQGRSSQAPQAVATYRLAARLSSQNKQTKLESIASVNEAQVLSKLGQSVSALELFQHALNLDRSLGDQDASADDWFAYGQFLANSQASVKLAYACLTKSAMLQSNSDQKKLVEQASQEIMGRVGSDAAAIQRDPEPFLREALALRK
jgi:tetratricopeptide (TPR) repeat protein